MNARLVVHLRMGLQVGVEVDLEGVGIGGLMYRLLVVCRSTCKVRGWLACRRGA